jgi:glycine/D-amino acid oxidase-like deaminating enzyme
VTHPEFDVAVVGAGFAGVCCAGTLVQQGLNIALIAEAPEVGWNLRPTWVGESRGTVQHPMWQQDWGGGWWFPLARSLSAEVRSPARRPREPRSWTVGTSPRLSFLTVGS